MSRNSYPSRRSAGSSKAKPQQQNCGGTVNPLSPTSSTIQTQFDLALTLLCHQIQQQVPGDVTRSSPESLLLSALGLPSPGASGGGVSDPGVGPADPSPTGLTPDPRRYKTELCRAYEERGQCRYGDRCQFAHGTAELRALLRHPKYKTELCRTYHTSGFCPYGARCHFVHNGASPPAPPPTPRDADPGRPDVGFAAARSSSVTPDSIQLSLLSAALEKQAASNHTTMQTRDVSASSSTTSLNDVMTSSMVESILHRRRPQVTLTLDPVPRYSPPAPGAPGTAPGPSRRSSTSLDSGYGSSVTASPTFPVLDLFSPPPPLLLPPISTRRYSGGPVTAPLPSITQSPDWLSHQHPPLNAVSPSQGIPHSTSNNGLYFVFDRLNIRQ